MKIRHLTSIPALHRTRLNYYVRINLYDAVKNGLRLSELSLRTRDFKLASERYANIRNVQSSNPLLDLKVARAMVKMVQTSLG